MDIRDFFPKLMDNLITSIVEGYQSVFNGRPLTVAEVSEAREQFRALLTAVNALHTYENATDLNGGGSGPEIDELQFALLEEFDNLRNMVLSHFPDHDSDQTCPTALDPDHRSMKLIGQLQTVVGQLRSAEKRSFYERKQFRHIENLIAQLARSSSTRHRTFKLMDHQRIEALLAETRALTQSLEKALTEKKP